MNKINNNQMNRNQLINNDYDDQDSINDSFKADNSQKLTGIK